jgi:hypothetical protein
LQFFMYLVDHYRVGVDYLEEVCELRLNCVGSHPTVVPSILAHEAAFWILIDRSLLIRD